MLSKKQKEIDAVIKKAQDDATILIKEASKGIKVSQWSALGVMGFSMGFETGYVRAKLEEYGKTHK
jgi:hypothetical protein